MITIVMRGEGGELDRCEANTPQQAANQMIRMVRECGELHPGDTFEVSGSEDED